MIRSSYRTYLAWIGLTFLILVGFSVSLCVYVDPYRFYGTGRVEEKPAIYMQQALSKTYMLERVRPNTLILGNDKVEMGIDPQSQDWPDNLKPAFNAAGADADVFMAWRLLQHDIAVKPPQIVLLGLDFLDFVQPQPQNDAEPPHPSELRLLVSRDGSPNQRRAIQLWKDFFATTLTRRAIADSFTTLRSRADPLAMTMTELGFNPAHEYELLLRQSGAESIFSNTDAIYRAQYQAVVPTYFYTPLQNLQFRSLAAIIRLAEQNDIRLIIFIPPYHSRYLEILHETGFWPSFEAWKRALVQTIDETAGNRRDLVLLYDFSDYDDISGERVPQPGDTQAEMRWYRDSTHFTSELGDLMIASMMGGGPVLGDELNKATLEADIERVRRDRDRLFAPRDIRAEADRRGTIRR